MELIVNIDDETYNDIKKGKIYSSFRDVPLESVNAIANGTPLPKGHGDLKDINDLCCKSRYGCKDNCEYIHTCNIYGAKTIIDADKESGNDI